MRAQVETCTLEGCGRPHKARGYCQTHYMQFRRGAPVTPEIATRVRDKLPECIEEGCSEPVKAKDLCHMHYQRYLRHGHTRYRDRKREPKICAIPDCDSVYYAKGVCHSHYIKWRCWKAHGIDAFVFLDMLSAQNGVCAICGLAEKTKNGPSGKLRDMSIDHCHETNLVRGILCDSCNRGIGLLKDDPKLLRAAARYIEHHRKSPSHPPSPVL